MIAPLWNDLDPEDGGNITYKYVMNMPDKFITQWTEVPEFDSDGNNTNTFQVALYFDTGCIEFRYGSLTLERLFGGNASVGVENINGTVGLNIPTSSILDGNTTCVGLCYDGSNYTVVNAPTTETAEPTTETLEPTSLLPSSRPSAGPSSMPSSAPSSSSEPTETAPPTASRGPSAMPSTTPSESPSAMPSSSAGPTTEPSSLPSKLTCREFHDISTDGNVVVLDDDDFAEVPLGGNFSFYEIDYANVFVSSNGFLSFGNGTGGCPSCDDYAPDEFPDPDDPNNMIAPLWNDLNPEDGGNITYKYVMNMPDKFITQWTAVPDFGSDGNNTNTFQVALYFESGCIEFRYGSLTLNPGSATIGVENINGTVGLNIPTSSILDGNTTCVGLCYDGSNYTVVNAPTTETAEPTTETLEPTSLLPSSRPSAGPSSMPSSAPSSSSEPTETAPPTASRGPSAMPSTTPSESPSAMPSSSAGPTTEPSSLPSKLTCGEFHDISTDGNVVVLDDDDFAEVPLGGNFSFYEIDYANVFVSSNGFLSFGDGTGGCPSCDDFAPDEFPDPDDPNNMIAPLWTDLNPEDGGNITYKYVMNMPDKFITQWTEVPEFGSDGNNTNTFQVALYFESGCIEFRYGSLTLNPGNTTVGVENINGTVGLNIPTSSILDGNTTCVRLCYDGKLTTPWLMSSNQDQTNL